MSDPFSLRIFVTVPGQLNKAHVRFLAANLVRQAKDAKRIPLDNGNAPTEPTLSEADRADIQVYLENMLDMLPVLGVQAFEQSPPAVRTGATLLICKSIHRLSMMRRGQAQQSCNRIVATASRQLVGQL